MKRFLSAMDAFTNRAGEGLAWVALGLTAIILYEVIARFVFNSPTIWAHETTSLVFGTYAVLGGAYCVVHDQHIKVDVLWARLSPRNKAITDLISSSLSLGLLVGILWFAIPWAWHSLQTLERSETVFGPPHYPFKMFLVIASFWLLLHLVAKFIRDFQAVRK